MLAKEAAVPGGSSPPPEGSCTKSPPGRAEGPRGCCRRAPAPAELYRALKASCPLKQPQEPPQPFSPVSPSAAGAEGCEERLGLSHAWTCQGQRPGSPLAGDTARRRWQLEGEAHGVGWSSLPTAPALPLLAGAQGRPGMALAGTCWSLCGHGSREVERR